MDSANPTLNLAKWDVGVYRKVLTESSNGRGAIERMESLRKMIRLLRFHREKLTKEIEALPDDNTLKQLMQKYDEVDSLFERAKSLEKSWSKLPDESEGAKTSKERERDEDMNKENIFRESMTKFNAKATPGSGQSAGSSKDDLHKVIPEKYTSICVTVTVYRVSTGAGQESRFIHRGSQKVVNPVVMGSQLP